MLFGTLSLGSLALTLGVGVAVVAVQPLLLGLAASLLGEEGPGWLKGALTLILAGIGAGLASAVYALTAGWLLARLGTVPAVAGALATSWLATSLVYSALLRIAVDRAAAMAALYWLISGALSAIVGALLRWAWG